MLVRNIYYYLLLLTLTLSGFGQFHSYRFQHLTYEEGLTNSNVYAFCQDNNGFVWIGTEGGIFRYDGFRFKQYKSVVGDAHSLNSNFVFSLLYDSHGNLWVGTYEGLLLYNELTDNFKDFNLSEKYLPGDAASVQNILEIPGFGILVASNAGAIVINPQLYEIDTLKTEIIRNAVGSKVILSYCFDSNENLWIGTLDGLYKTTLEGKNTRLYNLKTVSGKPESNIIVNIHEDNFGDLWLSTRGGGILRKKTGQNNFSAFLNNPDNESTLGSNETYDFWENTDGVLWISTNGSGINLFNRENETFSKLSELNLETKDLLNSNTRTIFEDRQGNLWISSFQAGVNILINTPYKFNYRSFDNKTGQGFQSTSVISFWQENRDIVWVGTDGGGLKRIDHKHNTTETFHPNLEGRYYFPDKVIMNMYKDFGGNIWMGTYLEGLIKFNPKTYSFTQFKNDPTNPNSISNNFVPVIQEDTRGNLWVGTNGGGLNLYDRNSKKFISFLNDPENPDNTIVNNYVNDIQEDLNGDLWIGTYWGLSKLDIRTFSFTNYLMDRNKPGSLSNNIIYCFLSDNKNRLWIGTRKGLVRYEFETGNFLNFPDIDGVSNSQISGILEDKNGNLWLSTDNGIIKYNPENNTVNRYSSEDGLQGNEFYHNACHQGGYGELFFGGYKGFNSFIPDSITDRFYEPEVVFTNLQILDKDIGIGELENGRNILEKNITLTEKINLKYSDKSISIGFSAVDFIEGNKNIYAYKLEGFDDDWKTTTPDIPFATYTNLSQGQYVLRVKAGKPEFITHIKKEKTITIEIQPPIWRTWWAYGFYFIFVVSVIIYFWRMSIKRLKEKNEIRLEKVKREQTEAISQARLRFFTNISHEIRTPLSLIIGPLEQLLAKGKETEPYRRQFDIMLKNARRLLRLINQLLDLRKIELDKMKLNAEYADIAKFIKDIVFSFEEYASDKKIDFKFTSQPENIHLWFDPDKMDKIAFNLLSNAFKYTSVKGNINVTLKDNVRLENEPTPFVELSVSDNGKGIKDKDLKHIFERFYQGETSSADGKEGSGLGLSLTHSFVLLHHGKMNVESAENVGTHFKVYFPRGDEHLSEKDIIRDVNQPARNKYIHISSEPYIDKKQELTEPTNSQTHKYNLLIVEDNKDLREYLMTEMESSYNCIEAADGKSGLELAIDIMPDFIISDIMMPGMNGYELCKSLKENIITSHIPVLLLTAKSHEQDQIMGFESGADAYIAKPFNVDKLMAQIESILINRQKVKEKFSNYTFTKKGTKPNSPDDKFLELVNEKITQRISDPIFGVEELSVDVGMSRAHLHRKMKAIADIGPNDYIRKIRMQRAAELLLKGDMNIAEVSVEVGFNSTSYFSTTFKSFFKVTPKTFIEKNS